MRNALVLFCVLLLPVAARAQDDPKAAVQLTQKIAEAPQRGSTINTNIQVEMTITDQSGSGAPDKKTVSMIVSDRQWGKIRASAEAFQKSTASKIVPVGLNVDARPIISEGVIRLEMTIVYSPMMLTSTNDSAQTRPTELNQSLTVALQSGKPLVVSQAADPVSDRKISVEVKATILK